LLVLLVLSACQKKDINALKGRITDLEGQLAALKNAVNTINTDIKSLQAITTALQNKVSVNSYTATSTGYLLTMSNGTTIELKNGTNGTNGSNGADAPRIGVKPDADGHYYWTIGSDWLLQNGQKIRVTGNNGTNGANGTTPLLMVNATSNQWMVSYDNGNTWSVIKDGNGNPITATGATGQNGPQGPAGPAGVTGFGITETADAIIITYNGSTYTLPKGGSSTPTGLSKMVLVTTRELGSIIGLYVDAAPADRSQVWIDLNNDEKQDPGEKINDFAGRREYTLNVSKTVSIYGKITDLRCDNNRLSALDISKNTSLVYLTCTNNLIGALDVTKNTLLQDLYCANIGLTSLDISKNTALTNLHCEQNKINIVEMEKLINALPTRTETSYARILSIAANEENALPPSAMIMIANAKNWKLTINHTEIKP